MNEMIVASLSGGRPAAPLPTLKEEETLSEKEPRSGEEDDEQQTLLKPLSHPEFPLSISSPVQRSSPYIPRKSSPSPINKEEKEEYAFRAIRASRSMFQRVTSPAMRELVSPTHRMEEGRVSRPRRGSVGIVRASEISRGISRWKKVSFAALSVLVGGSAVVWPDSRVYIASAMAIGVGYFGIQVLLRNCQNSIRI